MDGFQRRKEMKMKSILKAASELFSTREIKNVSIAEIAKKAEVSQVSIYNFFESKENLVREVLFAFMDEKMKESEMILNSDITFQQKLEKLFFVTTDADDKSNIESYKSALISDPLIIKMLEEYHENRTKPFLMQLVEQGKKEGCISNTLSDTAIHLYMNTFRELLAQPNITRQLRIDLKFLFFYGLQGK